MKKILSFILQSLKLATRASPNPIPLPPSHGRSSGVHFEHGASRHTIHRVNWTHVQTIKLMIEWTLTTADYRPIWFVILYLAESFLKLLSNFCFNKKREIHFSFSLRIETLWKMKHSTAKREWKESVGIEPTTYCIEDKHFATELLKFYFI